MSSKAKSLAVESSASVMTPDDRTLPSDSRLSLEAIKSLAQKISNGQIDAAGGAREIIQEVDGLIQRVKQREVSIQQWASGLTPQ